MRTMSKPSRALNGSAAASVAQVGKSVLTQTRVLTWNLRPHDLESGLRVLVYHRVSDDRDPLANVGSSQFAEYYTVIDAIGYTDSGFNGDYFAQNSGLNAPGSLVFGKDGKLYVSINSESPGSGQVVRVD